MANILAILDQDKKYVGKLANYMEKRGNMPFEIQGFDSCVRLHTFMQEHMVSVLLLSEKWQYEDFQGMAELIILLTDKSTSERLEILDREPVSVCKFQSAEMICKKVLNICTNCSIAESFAGAIPLKASCEIVGVYSPIKRSLQTSFAFIYSRLKSNRKKTLYLNFEVFSGFSNWFQKEFQTDLMDLMYFLNDEKRFLLKLASMTEQFGNVQYIPPAFSYEDFMAISAEQWLHFIQTIATKSDYEVIVLDLGDHMQGLFSILSMCDKIFTITKPDGLAQAKIATYEELLRLSGKEDVLRKTIKCKLPQFKEIPQDVDMLCYSQLAEYMKNKLGEIF